MSQETRKRSHWASPGFPTQPALPRLVRDLGWAMIWSSAVLPGAGPVPGLVQDQVVDLVQDQVQEQDQKILLEGL